MGNVVAWQTSTGVADNSVGCREAHVAAVKASGWGGDGAEPGIIVLTGQRGAAQCGGRRAWSASPGPADPAHHPTMGSRSRRSARCDAHGRRPPGQPTRHISQLWAARRIIPLRRGGLPTSELVASGYALAYMKSTS